MINPRGYYDMVSYGGSLFAVGGYRDGVGEINKMERYTPGQGWEEVANLPYVNHRWGYVQDKSFITFHVHQTLCYC